MRDAAWKLVHDIRRKVLTDPGRRAGLRRAVGREPGDPQTFDGMREISRYLPTCPHPDRAHATERAFLTVGALMCAQPRQAREDDVEAGRPDSQDSADGEGGADSASTPPNSDGDALDKKPLTQREPARSLGATLAFAVNQRVTSKKPAEGHLHRLCRSDAAAVHRQLPRLLSLVRNSRVSVDWVALICDLALWDDERHRIAATWLRDFYRGLDSPDEKPSTTRDKKEKK